MDLEFTYTNLFIRIFFNCKELLFKEVSLDWVRNVHFQICFIVSHIITSEKMWRHNFPYSKSKEPSSGSVNESLMFVLMY